MSVNEQVQKADKPEPTLHWSDCAIYNGPAYEPGPCDCGGYKPEDSGGPPKGDGGSAI